MFHRNTRNHEKSVGRASMPAAAISSWCVGLTLRKTFQDIHAWAFDPAAKPEKLLLVGSIAFLGCARLTYFLDTGWKACATKLKDFSRQQIDSARFI